MKYPQNLSFKNTKKGLTSSGGGYNKLIKKIFIASQSQIKKSMNDFNKIFLNVIFILLRF